MKAAALRALVREAGGQLKMKIPRTGQVELSWSQGKTELVVTAPKQRTSEAAIRLAELIRERTASHHGTD